MPLPLNVINNKTKQKYTLIFYDIAGENCVNPEAMNKYGMFIENANGIVMIIDPKQFGELFNITEDSEDYDDDDTAIPEKVAEAMYNAFGATSAEGGKCQVPLAAALSKSDILKDYLVFIMKNSAILIQKSKCCLRRRDLCRESFWTIS